MLQTDNFMRMDLQLYFRLFYPATVAPMPRFYAPLKQALRRDEEAEF